MKQPDTLLHLYYVLMMISFIISTFFYTRSRAVKMIFYLLLSSVTVEAIVEVCKLLRCKYYILYHFFTPLEYTLIALYFYFAVNNKTFKIYNLCTIVLFLAICTVSISINYRLESFPRVISYLECFLIIILSVLALLLLDIDPHKPVYRISDFWFANAFLFFNAGLFIVLFFDQGQKEIQQLFRVINQSFNCLFYILLSIGFLCLKIKKI